MPTWEDMARTANHRAMVEAARMQAINDISLVGILDGDTTEYRKQQARLLLQGKTTAVKAADAIREIEKKQMTVTGNANTVSVSTEYRGDLHSRLHAEILDWCGGILSK